MNSTIEVMELQKQQKHFLPRKRDAHKGDFGHVLIIGGYYGMVGAARMAAEAALRTGAGLVSIITIAEHVSAISGPRPEIMCHTAETFEKLATRANVIVIGPGLGQDAWSKQLLNQTLLQNKKLVIDADGLNLLAKMNIKPQANWILTPHLGEAARLMNQTIEQLPTREALIMQLQQRYGGVVILKGAGTLVRGDTPTTYQCNLGNPGMASGGMGDVLSGIIGGLLAQSFSLLEAAKTAVCIHAAAGDRAAKQGERGLIASDLIQELRVLVNPMLS